MSGQLPSPDLLTRWKGSQRRIGITGGIASGKSSVCEFLEFTKNLPIIDADVLAKASLSPGNKLTITIMKRYGEAIKSNSPLLKESIDRRALAKIIFNNEHERLWLDEQIQPIILKEINRKLDLLQKEPIIAIILPLLFEKNLTDICSEIWLVDCKSDQQINRLMIRDNITRKEALQKINSQWSMSVKKKFADVIINNSGKPRSWVSQVESFL